MTRIFHFCYRSPVIVTAWILLTSGLSLWQLQKLTIDASFDRILVTDSPEMQHYLSSVDTFGTDKTAILFLSADDLFTPQKLKLLQSLAWQLEKNPSILNVQSVFTSTFINHHLGELSTEPLFSAIDQQDQIDRQLEKVVHDPFHHNRLINISKNALSIILELDPDQKDHVHLARQLNEQLMPLRKQFSIAYQTGEASLEHFTKEEMVNTQLTFLPLITLVLFISFLFFIKSAGAFMTTVVVTGLAVLWSFSFLPIFGIPIQLMINIVPGIVLILSATEIIHLFASLKEKESQESGERNGEKLLSFVARDVGSAVTLTFMTTAIGFLSISFNDIQMLKEFGLMTFIGLICAFIATITYFPLHIKLFHRRQAREDAGQVKSSFVFSHLRALLHKLYFSYFSHPAGKIIVVLFCLANIYYCLQVTVNNDTYSMLSDRTQEKKDINHYQQNFGGTRTLFALIKINDSSTPTHSFKDPQRLNRVWQLHQKLEENPHIVHVRSYAGLVALLNREMNGGRPDQYLIPDNRNLIEQYMLTLSIDNIRPFINTQNDEINIRISHDISSSRDTKLLVAQIENLLTSYFPSDTYQTSISSRNYLNLIASDTIVRNQANSLLFMVIVIVLMLALFFKSLKVGFVSLIPNLFPIIGLFGVMGLFGVPLNIGTCIVASITIGIAADDTIHLFSRYFKERERQGDTTLASIKTIDHEVIPIATTSFSLAFSFFVFIFAKFVPLTQFGLLSSYVLILALISDLYIGPITLTTFLPKDQAKD